MRQLCPGSTHKLEPRQGSHRMPCGGCGAVVTGGTADSGGRTRAVPVSPPGLRGPLCWGGCAPSAAAGSDRTHSGMSLGAGDPTEPPPRREVRRAWRRRQIWGARHGESRRARPPGFISAEGFPPRILPGRKSHPCAELVLPQRCLLPLAEEWECFPPALPALPAGGKPSESLPAPAVSCVLRTVPITALQHLPGVFARRVDPAGDETPCVPPPSHGSCSPGDSC